MDRGNALWKVKVSAGTYRIVQERHGERFMEFILIWIFCGIVCSMIAKGKGRSGCAWFALGILFGPFAFVVAALPQKNKK